MSSKAYCVCMCHHSGPIVNCNCCQSALNIPTIKSLHEHHNRQIDENRAVSKRIDELENAMYGIEAEIHVRLSALELLDVKFDLMNKGMAKIEERLIALEKTTDYKSDIDAIDYILKSVEARLTALEKTEENIPKIIPTICIKCRGNGKFSDSFLLSNPPQLVLIPCDQCSGRGYHSCTNIKDY